MPGPTARRLAGGLLVYTDSLSDLLLLEAVGHPVASTRTRAVAGRTQAGLALQDWSRGPRRAPAPRVRVPEQVPAAICVIDGHREAGPLRRRPDPLDGPDTEAGSGDPHSTTPTRRTRTAWPSSRRHRDPTQVEQPFSPPASRQASTRRQSTAPSRSPRPGATDDPVRAAALLTEEDQGLVARKLRRAREHLVLGNELGTGNDARADFLEAPHIDEPGAYRTTAGPGHPPPSAPEEGPRHGRPGPRWSAAGPGRTRCAAQPSGNPGEGALDHAPFLLTWPLLRDHAIIRPLWALSRGVSVLARSVGSPGANDLERRMKSKRGFTLIER